MIKYSRPMELLDRISQYLVIVYQAIAVLAMIAIPFWALSFFQQPFLGVFLEHTMLTNGVGPDEHPSGWPLYDQGVRFGHQLLSLSFTNANNPPAAIEPKRFGQIESFLQGHVPGEIVEATFRSPQGDTEKFSVALSTFPLTDRIRFFFLPYLVGLVYLAVSLWIFGMRRSETSGRAFSILASSVALVVGGLLDLYTTNHLTYLWVAAIPLVGAALIHLGMVFPQEARFVLHYPFLRWVGYIPAFILIVLQYNFLFDFNRPAAYASSWVISYLFAGGSVLFFIALTIYRRFKSPSPVVRQQARTILIGAIFGFAPITIWLLMTAVSKMNFNPYFGFLPLVIFPVTTGYSVMRYRLLRTDYLLSRGVLYTLLTVMALVGYFLLSLGPSLLLGMALGPNNPLMIALAVFLMVLLLNFVRGWLQTGIDRIFFRGERAHQDRLRVFTRELTDAVALKDILNNLREQISASLLPSQLHIYVYDPLSDQYVPTPDEMGQLTSDIHFSSNSPLPVALRNENLPIYVDEQNIPESVRAERGRIALLGTQLFIPMPGRDNLVGWLTLGERLSGENYASHDISFLEALARQSAVALERAQVVTNMERRVQELNALSRVAQGINITLNFDDTLELIYAQTASIIQSSDFHLTLNSTSGQFAYYAFCLENDDRLIAKENIPLPVKASLDQEVLLSHRQILAQDFVNQCQLMGVTPSVKGIFAWLGVPLNSGSETIGAISVASKNPAVVYSRAQADLLQAVADQAASAIVKTRLLQETERRAQQLASLNQITRQLTSTLELQPLLKSILDSAVTILNTEAGNLFLVDEQTDELIFQATAGPVAQNLVGQRLPPGTGYVGKAVTSRQPIIANNVESGAGENLAADQQSGFVSRAILAVPLEAKGRMIGVIEIINKKDGNPFTDDDQNLLSAFAGQAAVAIDNARLYTLTDQELTDRVEELSVMQRIDRELNASLEVDHAMRITLEWAMRQSQSEAGLIGFLEEKGVRVIAHQGYGDELEPFKNDFMPPEHAVLKEAIQSGLPERTVLNLPDSSRAFLNGARSQLVIPIRRESRVIGLFLLESTRADAFHQDALAFLSRLSDHAAIAIANGQLYTEVRQANISKSEFVSFVAHELKNPMTSIKGYAELLAAGAVGPMSEMQSNFLSTIRANIERMKTIVEDLNDLSKIEAGQLRLDFKAITLAEVTENVVRSTHRQIDEKKQTIEVQLPGALPRIWADRTRVEQVLINLVSNANKYTQEGGQISIAAEKSKNSWDPKGSSEVVHIWVKDNGIGLTPDDQKKIFQKFFRSEDDQARKSTGTGLGLNITRSLVEMQGGRIWFESEYRKGTTFHVTVPVSEN
ncbi:MAG TPA: GAF domain-containing protein [Anaerolineales bacterium]|jgi:signal transduction histidine kinase/putative methionine-R-sulfoxide reductase with GAF domain